MIRDGATLPGGVSLESESFAPGWKLVEKRVPVGGIADVVEEHVKVGLAQYRLQRFEYGGEEPP